MKDFGVLVPVVTPCTLNGHIDAAGLRSVIAYMIAAGCNGIFVLGSTGRGPWFSLRDRALVCRVARDSCGRRPLYGGCMATGLDDMVESAAAMKDAGADCVVVTSPGYFDYGQEEIMRILLDFADRSPLPVLVYDIPGFARVKLDASVIQRLSGHGNIAGVKDATADMKGFRSLLGLLAKLPHFLVFQGKEQLLADSLRAGASGFVVSLVHLDPLPFVALRRAVALGREEEANKLQLAITAVLRSVEECINSRHTTSTLFHILNQALRDKGVCGGILLEHEGTTPGQLAAKARECVKTLGEAHDVAEEVMTLQWPDTHPGRAAT